MEHRVNDALHNYPVDGMDCVSKIQHRLGKWSVDTLESQSLDSLQSRIIDTIGILLNRIRQ